MEREYIALQENGILKESIGIETLGGKFTGIIKIGTKLPAAGKQIFSTATDNQTTVLVQVWAGISKLAQENRPLMFFSVTDIQPAPRGYPQIEVTILTDINGFVTVSAKDLDTKRNLQIAHLDMGQDEVLEVGAEQKREKQWLTQNEQFHDCPNCGRTRSPFGINRLVAMKIVASTS